MEYRGGEKRKDVFKEDPGGRKVGELSISTLVNLSTVMMCRSKFSHFAVGYVGGGGGGGFWKNIAVEIGSVGR